MKKLLIIALVVAVAAVFVNDIGKFTRARYNLSEATDYVVDQVSQYALPKTREESAVRAAEIAQTKKIVVYKYDQNGQGVYVWTQVTVDGTWLIGPFQAWRAGKPLETPYVIRDYGTSVYQ